jgi:hypothetical protein
VSTSGPSTDAALLGFVAGSLVLTARAVAALDEGPVPLANRPGSDHTDPGPLSSDKVVGEALLLLRTTAGAADDFLVGRAWRQLYDRVTPLARPETMAVSLCLDPANALENAFPHIQLSALGHGDRGLDLLLDLALAEPACGPDPYVVPELQRQWLRELRRESPDLLLVEDLLARSSLGRPADLLRCTMQEVYDLTHAVMHGTDLGSWTIRSPRPAGELLADLEALLGIALDADNLDLTAELLWSWPMLRLPWTPAAGFAFSVLSHAHDEHGFLPGPGFDADRHAALPEVQATSYLLRTSYHASLVFGMLSAAVLAANDGPVSRAAADAAPGSGRRLLEHIDAGPQRAWLRLLPDTGADPDGLSRMLLAIALRRRSDRFDLPAVRGLLELALELDLADGRVVRQAATLLRRGAALARHRSPAPVALTHTAASPARKAAAASAANPMV